jgi:hypothetical protein
MNTSDYIASFALLISFCSLAISLRDIIRDRYRLNLDGFMLWGTGNDGEVCQIGVTVTNKGRRPISITDIFFETDHSLAEAKHTFPIRTPIHGGAPDVLSPIELGENQPYRFMSCEIPLTKAMELPTIIDICVNDSTGKTHHVYVSNNARH